MNSDTRCFNRKCFHHPLARHTFALDSSNPFFDKGVKCRDRASMYPPFKGFSVKIMHTHTTLNNRYTKSTMDCCSWWREILGRKSILLSRYKSSLQLHGDRNILRIRKINSDSADSMQSAGIYLSFLHPHTHIPPIFLSLYLSPSFRLLFPFAGNTRIVPPSISRETFLFPIGSHSSLHRSPRPSTLFTQVT